MVWKIVRAVLLFLCGCSQSTVLDVPKPRTKVDTTYIPREIDTTQTSDVPIGFDVSVDDWDEEEIVIEI